MAKDGLTEAQASALERLDGVREDGSLYDLLGVAPEADAKEIQEAYYQLSREWHPDRFFRLDLGEDGFRIEMLFVSLSQAYKVLSDPLKRRSYDRSEMPAFKKRKSSRYSPRTSAPPPSSSPGASNEVSAVWSDKELARSAARRNSRSRVRTNGESLGDPDQDSDRARDLRARLAATRAKVSESRQPGAASSPRRNRRARQSSAVRQAQEEATQRLEKARAHFDQGKVELEGNQILKAASSLYLAVTFDPDNDEYKRLFDKANTASRKIQSSQFVAAAEAAEGFQRVKEAIANYRKACDLGSEDPRAYQRLASLVRRYEDDDREAVQLLRKAVILNPRDIDSRMALGQLYSDLGMTLNARREFQAVLAAKRDHGDARAALKKLR